MYQRYRWGVGFPLCENTNIFIFIQVCVFGGGIWCVDHENAMGFGEVWFLFKILLFSQSFNLVGVLDSHFEWGKLKIPLPLPPIHFCSTLW